MSGVTAVRPSTAPGRPLRDRSLAFKINAAVVVAVVTAGIVAIVALTSISSMASHAKAAEAAAGTSSGSASDSMQSNVASALHDQSSATRNVLLILFIGIAVALFIGWRAARSIRTDVNAV